MSTTQTTQQSKVKGFLKERFSKKQLIQKGIIAAIALAIVLVLALPLYYHFLSKGVNYTKGDAGDFLFIRVIKNSGFAFGALEKQTAAVYAIQAVISLLLIALYLFLCQDRITASFLALAIFGGLFNLFQRAASGDNTVLDYVQFGNWIKFNWIFNMPDVCVVVGIFGFIISYITLIIIKAVKEEKQDSSKQEIKTAPAPKTEKASK